jgi:hypothetical protein
VIFNEDDPRHVAAAGALRKGLGFGAHQELADDQDFVQALALKVLAAVAPLSWLSRWHRQLETCPGCGQSGLATAGLTDLAYEFVTCTCGVPAHPHLVEQLWHRRHMGRPGEAIAATARREALSDAGLLLAVAARTGEAPGRTELTYVGGIRRACQLVRQLRDETPDLEEGADGS